MSWRVNVTLVWLSSTQKNQFDAIIGVFPKLLLHILTIKAKVKVRSTYPPLNVKSLITRLLLVEKSG